MESDPFDNFYLLYKLQESPIKENCVCYDCASLTHYLEIWVDEISQPMVKAQDLYFKDSWSLKYELDQLVISTGELDHCFFWCYFCAH